jgi:tetratricopeptide (TPR) repeat protein
VPNAYAAGAEIAEGCGDDQALAAAHTALAMLAARESDRRTNFVHYQRALEHAERAGDVLQVIRIRANRGSHLVEESNYHEAVDELDEAIRLAELAGFASFQALALSNRGEALLCLGRLDEAIADLEDARAIQQRLGSRLISYPLFHLGDVFRERGDLALARVAYQEAVAVSEGAGDSAGRSALAGLARVLVIEEPEEAARTVDRALHTAPCSAVSGPSSPPAVALASGDADAAAARANEAAALSRTRRDRAALAESLELLRCRARPCGGSGPLEEAARSGRIGGAGGGPCDLELAVRPARRRCRSPASPSDGSRARGPRRGAGVRPLADLTRPMDVAVRTLGASGDAEREPVPLTEWQSRKARTPSRSSWPGGDSRSIARAHRAALAGRGSGTDVEPAVRGAVDAPRRARPRQAPRPRASGRDGSDDGSARPRAPRRRRRALPDDADAGLRLLGSARPAEGLARLVSAEAAYGRLPAGRPVRRLGDLAPRRLGTRTSRWPGPSRSGRRRSEIPTPPPGSS